MPSLDKEIICALNDLRFEEDELAYLALTSKIERPLRDRLAVRLHQKGSPKLIVAREWRKVDLAILDTNATPLALVECKACYTFDAVIQPKIYTDLMLADERKARNAAAGSPADVFSLLLATHLHGIVPKAYVGIVKYTSYINKVSRTHGTNAQLRDAARASIGAALGSRELVGSGKIAGGTAFGASVDLLFWLVKAPGIAPSIGVPRATPPVDPPQAPAPPAY